MGLPPGDRLWGTQPREDVKVHQQQCVGHGLTSHVCLRPVQVSEKWKHVELSLRPYKALRDTYVLGGVDEVQQVLEDSAVMMAAVSASRYVAGIRCVEVAGGTRTGVPYGWCEWGFVCCGSTQPPTSTWGPSGMVPCWCVVSSSLGHCHMGYPCVGRVSSDAGGTAHLKQLQLVEMACINRQALRLPAPVTCALASVLPAGPTLSGWTGSCGCSATPWRSGSSARDRCGAIVDDLPRQQQRHFRAC